MGLSIATKLSALQLLTVYGVFAPSLRTNIEQPIHALSSTNLLTQICYITFLGAPMALGWYWTGALLCVFLSVLAADMMGYFKSKNRFPVENRVGSPPHQVLLDTLG